MRFIPFSFPRENISRIFHLTFHFTFHLNVHLAFSPHFSTENPAFVFENSRRIHCAVPPRVGNVRRRVSSGLSFDDGGIDRGWFAPDQGFGKVQPSQSRVSGRFNLPRIGFREGATSPE